MLKSNYTLVLALRGMKGRIFLLKSDSPCSPNKVIGYVVTFSSVIQPVSQVRMRRKESKEESPKYSTGSTAEANVKKTVETPSKCTRLLEMQPRS